MLPEGVEGHLDHFLGMNDPDSNLMAVCKISGVLGTATAKRLLLPGFFFQTRQREPFVQEEKRLTPVDMHYGEKVVDEIVYHFPPSLAVEGTPQDTKIPLKDMAIYATKSTPGTNEVTIADQMLRGFAVVKPEEYANLREFYQKIAAADQQQLVFTAASIATKGN